MKYRSSWHPEFDGKCLACGQDVIQPNHPQGGGTTKVWCSSKCRARIWAREHAEQIRATKRKYANKPESKIKKAARQRERKYWKKYTTEFHLYWSAKQRAKEKNLEFTITFDDIKIPSTCPLLGIPIICGKGKGSLSPNSPSLDRIDSTRGYTPDNIWVISFKANTAKSNLTIIELKMLVEKLEEKVLEQKISVR